MSGARALRVFAFFFLLIVAALPVRAQETYLVTPGDRLTVTVLEDPNLNSQVLVRPDGRITLPIAGSIRVVGRTPEQIQAIVRDRLRGSFAVTPSVTVSVSDLAAPDEDEEEIPDVVYVLGQVNSPGAIEVLPPRSLTVLQAIARAGGLDRFARGEAIQIRRMDEAGRETIFPFNFRELEDGRQLSTNIRLIDGDVIFVPERGLFD
jgi:polysaccharide biosynthesis/export protein